MASTKQSARRLSTGGKAPRKIPRGPHCREFKDHAGRTYTVATSEPSQAIPKLGIQMYCLGRPSTGPAVLGDQFLRSDAIAGWGNARNRWPRVDVHTDFGSIEECIDHHRREKAFRKQANEEMRGHAVAGLSEEDAREKLLGEIRGREPLPHILPTWCPSEKFWGQYSHRGRYRSWILVIPEDRLSWEDVVEKGIIQVMFDLDITPAMETTMYDLDIEEDTCLTNDKHGWVEVEKSGLDDCEPVAHKLLCARDQPEFFLDPNDSPERHRELVYGWHTPGTSWRLFDAWVDATSALWDCTYRKRCCDSCDDGEVHSVCEADLDEHYFDEEGQCVACRRVLDYRRRSTRIAARAQAEA